MVALTRDEVIVISSNGILGNSEMYGYLQFQVYSTSVKVDILIFVYSPGLFSLWPFA